jgi:hypothetical protein
MFTRHGLMKIPVQTEDECRGKGVNACIDTPHLACPPEGGEAHSISTQSREHSTDLKAQAEEIDTPHPGASICLYRCTDHPGSWLTPFATMGCRPKKRDSICLVLFKAL